MRSKLLYPLIILLTGFALRLYRLGADSLWYDETVSAFLAGQPTADLIAHTARDIHPPGYYLLLRGWTLLVGQTEFALAFFSLIFGMLLIPLVYRLAGDFIHSKPIAIWAALFVAISPYNLWYSQEARMYTLGAFLGLAATWFALQAIVRPQGQTRRLWLGYILCAAIGLYTLYYFVFLLIAINLFFMMVAIIGSPSPRIGRGGWGIGVNLSSPVPPKGGESEPIPPSGEPGGAKSDFKLRHRGGWGVRALIIANSLLLMAYLPWLPIAWRQATNPPVPPWRSPQSFSAILLESWSALSFGQSVQPSQVWSFLALTLVLFIFGLFYLNEISSRSQSPSLSIRANLSPPAPPKGGESEPIPPSGEPGGPKSDLKLRHIPPLPRSPAPPPPNSPAPPLLISPAPLLLLYTFGPLLLIYLFSLLTPLYHVRYIFTYSPAFYIVLGAGIVSIAKRFHLGFALTGAGLVIYASFFSFYQYHFDPRYRPDDFRAAVDFIERHWQPGDVILANAGYAYTAFLYYTALPNLERERLVPYRSPSDPNQPRLLQTGAVDGPAQLGWGDPRSDFYAMTTAETIAALENLADDYPRLWLLRVYDTVTDPQGLIRAWLAENAILLEDQGFAGESYLRAQAFLLAKQPALGGETIYFEDGLALAGWNFPIQTWQPGQTIQLQLGWLTTAPPGVDYKMSLKLWSETGEFAAQGDDTWPVGTLYRATAWPVNQVIYHPAQISLPNDLPPGRYWLNVELYHPETALPLPRLDGADPVVTLGPVVVD